MTLNQEWVLFQQTRSAQVRCFLASAGQK